MKDMSGKYHLKDLMLLLNLQPDQYAHLKTAVNRACTKGIGKSVGGRDGWYQTIDRDYDILNFKGKNPQGYFSIKYPFGLEEYIKTPRRGLVIVGGSPDAGKSAWVHNVINLNWREHQIVCWDSENSDAELEDRLRHHPSYLDWPDDLFRSKSENFEDVIEPDAINIIDYLEAPEKLWEIRRPLRHIRDKLKDGIAIICLQKPEGRDLPYGKEFAKQLPRIVIAMERGVLKIVKGKAWQTETNPEGLRWSYKIVSGEKFMNITPLGKEF